MQLESSVTLFDDEKVESKFAELRITADGITAEVSRKVGNDEVISRINQSAEAVTINANKVNIDGVITAINNGSSTTINGGKITTGTLNGDRIIANTINGDRIIANTVSAGAINADSGTFNTANIPNLNADKITAGNITADRMKLNSISAVNGNTGTLKISAGKLDISGVITAINDNTTTTIDGDKITTGTVKASAINASSGTFNTANIPNLSATKITSDTINGARINAMGASGGARATLTSTGLDIYNSSNQKKASYGATQYIYGGNGTYPLVSVDGTNARLMQSANNYANVNSDGLQIYQSGASIAEFGSTARIGATSGLNLRISGSSLYFYLGNTHLGTLSSGANNSNIMLGTTSKNLYLYANDGGVILDGNSNSVWGTLFCDSTIESDGRFKSEYCYSNTISTDNRVAITSAGNMGRYKSSSRRYKEFIEDSTFDPHGLYDLKARQFKYKDGYFSLDDNNPRAYDMQVGFIAEEVEALYPEAVVYDADTGEAESWEERKIIPPMLTLIQELNDRVSELERRTN